MNKRIDAKIVIECNHKDCYYQGHCMFSMEEKLGRMYIEPKARITSFAISGHYNGVHSPRLQIECENFKMKGNMGNDK